MLVQATLSDEIIKKKSKVRCEVCGREFEFIAATHLKTHGITMHEYREQFPDASLTSEGYRKKLSKAKSGKNHPMHGKEAWNKGKTKETDDRVKKMSEKNHYLYGRHLSEPTRQLMSDNHLDNSGEKNGMYGVHRYDENAPNYKGGPDKAHARYEEKRRDFGFIPLNDKFPGSDAHHLNKELVLYIPSELHNSVYHNMHTGQGMEEMNNLACEYVYGIETNGKCFLPKKG